MNHCAIQQNGVVRSRDEMRDSFTVGSALFTPGHRRWDAVVCPKPRRVGVLSGAINGSSGSPNWHTSHQTEESDSKAGSELLDIILAKSGHGTERSDGTNISSSPFLCGSPPSRASNPLIQDARFNDPLSSSSGVLGSPTSASVRKGGCVSVRANFGDKPVVRIEGFDCLDRDRSRNCSIPALA